MRFRLFTVTLLLLTFALPLNSCAKRARTPASEQQSPASLQVSAVSQAQPQRINLNTASANELETLPGIGKALAQRIIDHRERYGRFRRPEHLIIVRGISDKRFRALRDFITVE